MENLNDIKVSVIVPIYNAFSYLRPALDSIVNQTLENIEIICVDDGSTDRSLEVLKEYQAADSRIRIVTETNAGPGLARNNGINRARGEYLAFFDADDFYEPSFLELLYERAKRDDLDIAFSQYDIYNTRLNRFEPSSHAEHSEIYSENSVTSKSEYPDLILSSTVASAWNKIFRKSFVLDKKLSFLTDVRLYEDVYFVVTAMSLAERVGKVHQVLMHHRIHSKQSRAIMFGKYYMQIPTVYERIKEFLVSHGMYAPLVRSYLNISVGRCYKVFNLLSEDSKKEFWTSLSEKYAELLGWNTAEEDDFEFIESYSFVVALGLYTYDEYKKRLASENGVSAVLEIPKRRRKFRAFVSKIFRKKHKA